MRRRDGGEDAESRIGLAFVAVHDVGDLAQHRDRLGAKGADNMNELDDAQPPFPALILGDERLRLGKALGNLLLGQPLMPAQLAQQLSELLLLRRAQGIAHGGWPRSTTAGLST